ncbi:MULTISPECIES: energy-coupling factor transporter ATPase [Peptoniphilus]|mgnify:FL=1|uniref:energy-coupling factor transporter ATPase n=1 Tax=Peptoniphilus TaxID=162289 RepID=UPI000289B23E|nr:MULTISPECIES: energy-coupling factor transporter ATPase [Peptoniphilus]MBS6610135.1 energy-coupling factor transporter ATPase [Peptoniphilus harei]MDU1954090.1 energy-coupling factor transporter ATPase [Peptoniphilus lacydonensis]MDU2115329.1 energy-coupling factor transporter ATPase [Peptoniphilus lacydonensis]MDU5274734.1 energy-coupling factor transporter ATPase [Peptoniphilus lacydonensis]MDU5376713.1 energy-coupling factor transporter ATPase [Peptoniphilus lacydonensis]
MSLIEINNLTHIYSEGMPFEKRAIDNLNLKIEENEFIGLIGHTGSGKSTFIQHLNGLLKPSSGEIIIDGKKIDKSGTNLTELRKKIGLVFQYPEYQLFEETIEKDIAFGPNNLELSEEEVLKRVKNSMDSVGLDYEIYKDKSPFDLSGGLKRRVAIAGVLAMEPKVLILDEPTAGLDPRGRDEILSEIKSIHEKRKITVILVSHSMEDVAKIAERIIVMDKGKLFLDSNPREIFRNEDKLLSVGLGIPQITSLMRTLKKKGLDINEDAITVEEAKESLEKYLRGVSHV